MQALARFAMRGRSQAALVAATAAVLSVLPFVGVLTALVSAGVVVLATLRQGAGEGLLVTGIAGLGGGLLAWLALGSPWPALGFLLLFWLPAWLLAVTLGFSRSLALTVQAAAALAWLAFGLLSALSGRLGQVWRQVLEPLGELLIEAKVFDAGASQEAMAQIALWLPGLLTVTLYLLVLASLLLGRWWQGVLYNPGGFGVEFRVLRLHPGIGIAALALYLVVIFSDAHWAVALLSILATLLMLQGLAVLHAVRWAREASPAWLAGLYVIFALGFPFPQMAVAGLGLADIWADFRRRLIRQGPGRG